MEERSIKLIRSPSFFRKRQFTAKLNYTLIPPLGVGLISGFLRSHGISIEQDDLNIKIHYDNTYPGSLEDAIDTDILSDTARILDYARGGADAYLSAIMEKAALKCKICNNQIVLLSLSDNIENDTNLMFLVAFTRFIKERYNCLNIIGGDSLWLDLLKNKYDGRYIDYIIYGEGEAPLYYLLKHILNHERLDNISGLEFSDDGKIIRSHIVSKLIQPDFSGLPIEKYRSQEEILNFSEDIRETMNRYLASQTLVLPYRFIRGCPYECAFCVSSSTRVSDVLTPEQITIDLMQLKELYNPTGFLFLNDTINISSKFVNALCSEIIRKKLKILWSDCARADNLNKSTLLKMRRAGCIRLIFGMETASPRLLKYINKRIDLRQLRNAFKWAHEAGIWTGVEVICGLPHERDEDIDATVRFLNSNSRYINRIYPNHFDLRENTPFYNQPARFGINRIFEVNQYAEKDFISYVKFGFDEENGLSWHDKNRQIERSLKTVLEKCIWGIKNFNDEHLLFFLYSNLTEKNKVDSVFQKIRH
ncbi:MAG: radical SAM protein [Candidatus Omnitrophica bacterium]|nr:radical SAM protein [Candidatus Omnitrophota bacterium]